MSKKILIVDDEEDIIRLLKQRLDKEGFNVLTASDGEEALQLAEKELPDLIILDIYMPELSGRAVRTLLEDDPRTREIPIIFLTALKVEEIEKEYPDTVVIDKPYNPEDLVAKVNKVLSQPKSID